MKRIFVGFVFVALLPILGCASGASPQCSQNSDCPSGSLCDPRAHACYSDLSTALSWVSPSSGTVVGPSGVTLTASLRLAAGQPTPSALSLSVSLPDGGVASSALSQVDAGLYAAPWSPPSEGTFALVALAPGLLADGGALQSQPVQLTGDLTPPNFIVQIAPHPAWPDGGGITTYVDPGMATSLSYYRRDETAPVTIYSTSTDVNPSSVTVSIQGIGDSTPTSAGVGPLEQCTNDNHPFCRTTTFDLSKPTMNALRGTFQVFVSGSDAVGNTALVDAGVDVSRWKWSFDTGSAVNSNGIAPSIGHAGAVYVGTQATSALFSILPDGTRSWVADAGTPQNTALTLGVASDGSDRIYSARSNPSNSAQYGILDYQSDGGLAGDSCFANGNAGSASMALLTDGGTETVAMVINSGTSSGLLALVDINGPAGCTRPAAAATSQSVATDGTNLYYGDDGTNVHSYILNGSSTSPNWSSSLSPIGAPSLVVLGNQLGGGGSDNAGGGFFAIQVDGGIAWEYPSDFTTHAKVGNAISDGLGNLYAPESTPAIARIQVGGTSEESVSTALVGGPIAGAPILGAGGTLYTVGSTGTISAWDTNLGLIWSEPIGSSISVAASPNLDCSRDPDGGIRRGAPGVLYVASATGQIYAIVVDSPGIDTTPGGWPMYLHDPRHTANSTTDLQQFSCQ